MISVHFTKLTFSSGKFHFLSQTVGCLCLQSPGLEFICRHVQKCSRFANICIYICCMYIGCNRWIKASPSKYSIHKLVIDHDRILEFIFKIRVACFQKIEKNKYFNCCALSIAKMSSCFLFNINYKSYVYGVLIKIVPKLQVLPNAYWYRL